MTMALLEEVTQRVSMLAGDFSLEEGSNPCVQIWRAHGFVEVQELYERLSGCSPRVTCKGCTRKDFVYVSPEVQSWFVKTDVDPGPFPDHSLLMGHFRVPGAPEPRLLWPRPQSRPAVTLSKLVLPAAPCPDIASLEPSSAYRAVCAAYEDRLSAGLQQAGLPALLPQERGRASVESPVASRAVIPPVRKARHGELEATFFGSSLRHVQWLKQTRRVQACAKSEEGQSHAWSFAAPGFVVECCVGAPGFPGGFARWWPTREVCQVGDPPAVPACLPSVEVASGLFHSLVANLRAFEGEKTQAVVSEVRSDEAAVCLDREACWKPGPLCVNGRPLEVHHAEADMVWGDIAHVTPQSSLVADLPGLFRAFGEAWQARWSRHEAIEPSRWHEATAGLVHLAQDRVMSLAPITEELWRSTVRAKPMHTSTGLDGLSRADMLAMPSDLLQLILQLCSHAEQTGRWPRQAVLGVVSALEKRVGAETVGDYRPITVLSLLYRTWSSIRSRQALAYLSEFAPASMYGNLSGRTASQLWFSLQLQLEEARYAGVGVVGAIADLEKAFNLLPSTPVMAAARAVGIAEPILVGWCGAAMRRHFRIRGSVGLGLHSCTGFPEGCGPSCLAMALLDLSLSTDGDVDVR